ncbi:MAG: hypothetical protein GZ094_18445 [Mariniphaga sp.]|nr:hypothetical protein [Mariniphaga sp.]
MKIKLLFVLLFVLKTGLSDAGNFGSFSFFNQQLKRVVEPSVFDIKIGGNSVYFKSVESTLKSETIAVPAVQITDKNKVDILISPKAGIQEAKAADQLCECLKVIYPTYKFSVTTVLNKGNRIIRMGLPGYFAAGEPILKEIPIQNEGFIIRSYSKNSVVIVSQSPKGLFNAVYSLLEKLGYDFYLSYDVKPVPKNELLFNEWEISDYPLQSERLIFNWHNFLSGCTGWNYEDWCSWIDQSAKMKFNTIMVHAYGNNPMFSFEYNGLKKDVGYLTTSISGRDWGAQHIKDVRTLPGGEIFSGPIFGSSAAMVPNQQRSAAATNLMAKVFEHASEMSMKINFAIDVDTWSANPRNIIESLPAECRIKLKEQDIVNPETPDGYKYYKEQVKSLLTSYPQISTITVWVRHESSLWRLNIKPEQFPASWLNEWNLLIAKNPGLENDKYAASTYAISKIVIAYKKALKDIKRDDVNLAFGSWKWDFLTAASVFMPKNCTLIPLDFNIVFDSENSEKILSKIGNSHKVIPVVWAHHDDHRYVGRPYTPYTDFNKLLKERNAAGFGIIHWTTRPMDLYFKSLAEQVWSRSENKSIDSTISDYNRSVFGSKQQALQEYMSEWLNNGPMFGRETGGHFFDLGTSGEKFEPDEVTLKRINKRINILAGIDKSSLSEMGKKMADFYLWTEQFYMSLFQNKEKFSNAYDLLARNSIDSAKLILQTVTPEKTIELYTKASTILPITSGEKALVISLGTRWLPDFINLKQRARMMDICYKFEATQHDALAQWPGTSTYFIDDKKTIWSCLGEKEVKAGVAGYFSKEEAFLLPANSLSYLKIADSFTLPLVTIGKNLLAPGKYRLSIQYVSSSEYSGDCKLSLINKNNNTPLQTVLVNPGQKLKTISSVIELKDVEKYSIQIEPGNSEIKFTNLIISPI